jgi:hypothetical protein
MSASARRVGIWVIVLVTLVIAFFLIRSVQVPYRCPNMPQTGVCDPPAPVFDRRLELRTLTLILGLTAAWLFSRLGRRPVPWTEG